MTRGRRNRHETAGRLPGLSLPGYKGTPSVCTVHRPADSWTADHMLTSSERVVIGQLRRQSGVGCRAQCRVHEQEQEQISQATPRLAGAERRVGC